VKVALRKQTQTNSSSWSTETLDGTLRSEFDEDDAVLHPEFELLINIANTIRVLFVDGRLPPERTAEILSSLRITAIDNSVWTVGATSGRWFRRRENEDVWKMASIPVGAAPSVERALPSWAYENFHAFLAGVEEGEGFEENGENANAGAPRTGNTNPFQTKGAAYGPSFATAYTRPTPTKQVSEEDNEWLRDEWEDFDKELEQIRRLRKNKSVIDGEIPKDLDPDQNLQDTIHSKPPVKRNEGGDIDPEQFFRAPSDD